MNNKKHFNYMMSIIFMLGMLINAVDFIKFTTGNYIPSKFSIGLYILGSILLLLSLSGYYFEKGRSVK